LLAVVVELLADRIQPLADLFNALWKNPEVKTLIGNSMKQATAAGRDDQAKGFQVAKSFH